jgi:hypothetical protein
MAESESALYRNVTRQLRRGRLTPFLGAGVNLVGVDMSLGFEKGRRLPSGAELAGLLTKEYEYDGEDPHDLVRVAQWVELTIGRADLEESLREVFNRDFPPTVVHDVLARTPDFVRHQPVQEFPLIITTNYDDALERAFAARGEPIDVLTYVAHGPDRGLFRHTDPDAETGVVRVGDEYAGVTLRERPAVVKLHGAVSRSSDDDQVEDDSYVLTEDDYIECLSNPDIVRHLPAEVARRMAQCHYLFLGYSLRDWNMRVMLHRFSQDRAKQKNSWAVVAQPEELEQKAWLLRHVDMYDLDLGIFAAGLAREMDEDLAESRATVVT